jgi:ureidoacrylate peracid hydrolase
MDPAHTALVVDLQNGFMAPGQPAEIAQAREIVPDVNRLARATRAAGGTVVWIQNTITPESEQSWSVWLGNFADADWGPRMQAFPGDFGHAIPRPQCPARRPDGPQDRFSALVRAPRPRYDLEGARHRHVDHRRHRHQCVLRINRARRDDAELQGVLRLRRQCLPKTDEEHNATLAIMLVMFADAVDRRDDRLLQQHAAPVAGAAE